MQTLVNANQLISRIWGLQKGKTNTTYRMMKYVLLTKKDKNILLHNVVTGQLVKLNSIENEMLNHLPVVYAEELKDLVENHFLVPEEYEDHLQVSNLRSVLRKMSQRKDNTITNYTILPTTACNARCYYCFEAGLPPVSMTEQTANQLVNFISRNCGSQKKIHITWFGGEPTVAWKRIDQICNGLNQEGIQFTSKLITNGYFLREELLDKAKGLWNVLSVQLTVDGVGENYNKIKNYINPVANPYNQIIENVGQLIQNKIYVDFRMNFDLNNFEDFESLLEDVLNYFGNNSYLRVYAHPISGEYIDDTGQVCHGDETWYREKLLETLQLLKKNGLYTPNKKLPYLRFTGCRATVDYALTVLPNGDFVKCPEQIDARQKVGSIWDGITNEKLVEEWKQFIEYRRCEDCFYFPACEKILFCNTSDRCDYYLKYKEELINSIFTYI